jgi:hypothetical protein
MQGEAGSNINGNACINAAIRAFDQVDKPVFGYRHRHGSGDMT